MDPIVLTSLLETLKDLKKDNVDRIYLQDDTLDLLKSSVDHALSTKKAVPPDLVIPDERPIKKMEAKQELQAKPSEAVEALSMLFSRWDWPSTDPVICYNFLKEKWSQEALLAPFLNNINLFFGKIEWQAPVLFCAEYPHLPEVAHQSIFEGDGGVLLHKIMLAIGQPINQYAFTYLLPWSLKEPERGISHTPSPLVYQLGLHYLKGLLQLLKPKVIVLLGSKVMETVFSGSPQKMADRRGAWDTFEHIPTLITYSPHYLIHNGTSRVKRQFWEDMLGLMTHMQWPVSDKQRQFFQ